MAVQLEEGLVRYRFAGLLLGTHVDRRQQMVLHALYLTVRNSLKLTHRAEIENAAEVVFALQTRYIRVGSVMQMSGAQQAVRTDGFSSGSYYTA